MISWKCNQEGTGMNKVNIGQFLSFIIFSQEIHVFPIELIHFSCLPFPSLGYWISIDLDERLEGKRISCKISKAKRYDERKMTEMNNYRISNILNTQKNKKNMMN